MASPSSSERSMQHDTSYLTTQEVSTLVVTYNCNSKIVPDAHTVSQILREKGVGLGSNRVKYDRDELLHHDIVVFGLQEMVKLDANNVVLSGELSAKRVGQWSKLIETALNATDKYLGDSVKVPDGDYYSLSDNAVSDIDRISAVSGVSILTEVSDSTSFKINRLSVRPTSMAIDNSGSDNMNNINSVAVRRERLLSMSDDDNDDNSISTAAKREKDNEILSYFGVSSPVSSPVNTFAGAMPSFEDGKVSLGHEGGHISSDEDFVQTLYECKGYQNMVGITIFLFVKKKLSCHVRNVQCGVLARGIGGVLGNKGAACIRMDLYDTSVCFVCAHMAASRNQLAKRNEDYNAIILEKIFKGYKGDGNKEVLLDNLLTTVFGGAESPYNKVKVDLENARKKIYAHIDNVRNDALNAGKETDGNDLLTFKLDPRSKEDLWLSADDHDIVIFMGDLNYRLTKDVDLDEVYSFIGKYYEVPSDPLALPYLLNFDQLVNEKLKKNIFKEFLEGTINFPPTYQYIPGTSEYDQRPDHKMRMPAWCDRILWRVGKSGFENREINGQDERYKLRTKLDNYLFPTKEEVEQVSYVACESGLISDHKAVKSILTLRVKDVNRQMLEKFLQKTGKALGDPSIPLTFRPGIDFLNAYTVRKPLLITPGFVSLYTVPPKYSQQEIKVTLPDLSDATEYKVSVRPCGNTFPNWLIISSGSGYISAAKHSKFKFVVKVDQAKAYLEYSQLDKFRANSQAFRSVQGFEKRTPEVSTYILVTIESLAYGDRLNIEQDVLLPVMCVLGPNPGADAW